MPYRCKGKCGLYKPMHSYRDGRYKHGLRKCRVCAIWMNIDGNICPCCGTRLRTRPHTKAGKELLKNSLT